MGGEANIWQVDQILKLQENTVAVEETFTATLNQKVFVLTQFAYTPNAGALEVYLNGKRLVKFFEWVEVSQNSFTLLVDVDAGDYVTALGNLTATLSTTTPLSLLGDGVWAAGKTFTGYNQYLIYNGVSYVPKTTTLLPYTVGMMPDTNLVTAIDYSSASAVQWGTKSVQYALDDLDGWTKALFAAAEVIEDGLPDTDAASQRLEAMQKLFTGVVSLADVTAGKVPVGVKVRIADLGFGLFEIKSGGVSNGMDIRPAGAGKTAQLVITGSIFRAEWVGYSPDNADNAAYITRAKELATPLRLIVELPCSPLEVNCTTVLLDPYDYIRGVNRDGVRLKLPNNSNVDMFKSRDADSMFGTDSEGGAHYARIENLTINNNRNRIGNLSGNTTGVGIKLYGRGTELHDIKVLNCGSEGIMTGWGVGAYLTDNLEGKFSKLVILYSGHHGWLFDGPHDSHVDNILIVSSSQKATGTYNGLYVRKGNARWSKVHSYSLAVTPEGADNLAVRCAYDCYVAGGGVAEGNEFTLGCHFEGGNVNFYNGANNTTTDDSTKFYYPWNGRNIINEGSSSKIHGTLAEEYKGIGLPYTTGISLGGSYGGVSNCDIDLLGTGMDNGYVDFGGSAGHNSIKIRGYNQTPGSIAYLAQPHATDDVDLYVSGVSLTVLRKSTFQTLNTSGKVTAAGTVYADATPIDISLSGVALSGPANAGVRVVNTAYAGNDFKLQITEISGSDKKIYPNTGSNFLGYGINNPITLPAGKTVWLRVVDADAGEWMVSFSA